jgi:hypothetical protein
VIGLSRASFAGGAEPAAASAQGWSLPSLTGLLKVPENQDRAMEMISEWAAR